MLNSQRRSQKGGRYVGRLAKTLYGTRDAPVAWQRVVKSDMARLGFEECRVTTGVYVHRGRDMRVVTQVDVLGVRRSPTPQVAERRTRQKVRTQSTDIRVAAWRRSRGELPGKNDQFVQNGDRD